MKHILITLTMGLFMGPLFSQVGNYQKIGGGRAYTLRNQENGNVFYNARRSYEHLFAEVDGAGNLRLLENMPDFPVSHVPSEDTVISLYTYQSISDGFLLFGTKYLRQAGLTSYVGFYVEKFDWNYNSTYRYDSGEDYPVEAHFGTVFSDTSIAFLGHDWNWNDSSYVRNDSNKFFYSFNFETKVLQKDTVKIDGEWDQSDFRSGIWFGNRVVKLDLLNSFFPYQNWVLDLDSKEISKLELPFSVNPDYSLQPSAIINSDRTELLLVCQRPLRKGDFPDFVFGETKKIFFYYLNADLEIVRHYPVEDIEYFFHSAMAGINYHGNKENLFGDTVRLFYAFNEIRNGWLDSISPYTGEVYTDGFLYSEIDLVNNKVLDRRFINRLEVTGENFDPNSFGHSSRDYFFNQSGDSVTCSLETTIGIDKYEFAVLTVALDDMPLSTPRGLTASQIRLYPNPASEEIQVQSQKPGKYSLFNQEGKNVGSGDYWPNSTISLKGLVPGAYVIQIEERNSPPQQYRFLIKK